MVLSQQRDVLKEQQLMGSHYVRSHQDNPLHQQKELRGLHTIPLLRLPLSTPL